MDEKTYKNAHSKASTKYDRDNCVIIAAKLNRTTDADIIAALETVENRAALIKKLLRAAIADSEKGASK